MDNVACDMRLIMSGWWSIMNGRWFIWSGWYGESYAWFEDKNERSLVYCERAMVFFSAFDERLVVYHGRPCNGHWTCHLFMKVQAAD